MANNAQKIKELRELTGSKIIDCQKALKEAKDDIEKAVIILRKKGQKVAEEKQSRNTKEGIVEAYIHSNKKIGVLLELVCETDFVARNKEFQELAHDLAMQIAATSPKWISPEDVPEEIIKKEKEIIQANLPKDKPKDILEKAAKGKLEKFYQERCLLKQTFIKDDKKRIEDLIQDKIAKLRENIKINKFTRSAI